MFEMALELFIENTIEALFVISIGLATLGYNSLRKPIKTYLGIRLAEIEAYQVAKYFREWKNNYGDFYNIVLTKVSDRLKENGLKISDDEISEIIKNIVDQIIEEEEAIESSKAKKKKKEESK